MAYNFNNDPGGSVSGDVSAATGAAATESPQPASTTADPSPAAPDSAGFARFNSCRWQQPKDEGTAAFCTHREVKPYAGTAGFDADAWCPECQYYKLRRAPKKRTPNDDYWY